MKRNLNNLCSSSIKSPNLSFEYILFKKRSETLKGLTKDSTTTTTSKKMKQELNFEKNEKKKKSKKM